MKKTTTSLKKNLILILLGALAFNQAMAASEKDTVEKATAIPQEHKNHAKYHGVFYGVLPCKDCVGTKTTLSLKNKNNYLIVTQPAKNSAREYYEKGKYTWDDETQIVTLTSRKNSAIRKYQINNESTLTELSPKGIPLKTSQKNTSYVLRQKEMVEKKALMHGH